MNELLVLLLLGAIIFIGFLAEVLFRRLKVPDVIILLAIGFLLSRFYDLGASPLAELVPLFTTFALVFILFEGALRLEMQQLFSHLPRALLLALVAFSLSAGAAWGVGVLLGLDPTTSLLIGFILGGTTSAIVIPLLRFLNVSKGTQAVLTLESALNDVICIVSTVLLTELIIIRQFDPQNVLNGLLATILIALAIGVGAGYFWQLVLQRYRPENSYFLTIGLLLLVYVVTEYVQANGAIACLAFGLLLGNAKQVHETLRMSPDGTDEVHISSRQVLTRSARIFYAEISFFVKTFFFVYLGMLFDIANLSALLVGAGMVVATVLVRPVAVWASRAAPNKREAGVMEVMMPKGMAAAVLAGVPLQAGVMGAEVIPNIVVAGIFTSIVLCSALIFLIQRGTLSGIYRWGPLREEQAQEPPPAES